MQVNVTANSLKVGLAHSADDIPGLVSFDRLKDFKNDLFLILIKLVIDINIFMKIHIPFTTLRGACYNTKWFWTTACYRSRTSMYVCCTTAYRF